MARGSSNRYLSISGKSSGRAWTIVSIIVMVLIGAIAITGFVMSILSYIKVKDLEEAVEDSATNSSEYIQYSHAMAIPDSQASDLFVKRPGSKLGEDTYGIWFGDSDDMDMDAGIRISSPSEGTISMDIMTYPPVRKSSVNCNGEDYHHPIHIESNRDKCPGHFVGINNKDPTAALDVIGNTRIRGNVTIEGHLLFGNMNMKNHRHLSADMEVKMYGFDEPVTVTLTLMKIFDVCHLNIPEYSGVGGISFETDIKAIPEPCMPRVQKTFTIVINEDSNPKMGYLIVDKFGRVFIKPSFESVIQSTERTIQSTSVSWIV